MTDFQKRLIEVANMNDATRGIISDESATRLEEFARHMLKVN